MYILSLYIYSGRLVERSAERIESPEHLYR